MTSARIQSFCKKNDINIGCFVGTGTNPRNTTQRNISLFIYKNYFCLLWKSNCIRFNRAIEELKFNFKVVDNVVSDKIVKRFVKCEYYPKKFNLQ